MKRIDWTCVCLSLLVGLLLGMAVGVAAHWVPGAAISVVWMALHAVTWGFAAEPPAPVQRDQLDVKLCL